MVELLYHKPNNLHFPSCRNNGYEASVATAATVIHLIPMVLKGLEDIALGAERQSVIFNPLDLTNLELSPRIKESIEQTILAYQQQNTQADLSARPETWVYLSIQLTQYDPKAIAEPNREPTPQELKFIDDMFRAPGFNRLEITK